MGRVKEELHHYGDHHLDLIEKAFGQTERERAEDMTLIVREGERDRVDFEPDPETLAGVRFLVYHDPINFLAPVVPFHEFCHVMHIVQWPRISYMAPERRCEACAVLGELWLARKLPSDHFIRRCMEHRAVWVHPPDVVATARWAMLECGSSETHIDAMARIMGVFRVRGQSDA